MPLITLLGGTPGTSGSWTFNDEEHSAIFDPEEDVSGAYVYRVTGLAPCANAEAQVQITLVQQPIAGSDGTLAACVGDDAIELITGLTGSPNAGGTWNDDDGTGELNNGQLDASSLAPGVYHFTYTVAGIGPCGPASATVTVELTDDLDAGEDAQGTICENELIELFTVLGGSPQGGGTWTDLDGSGGLIGGVFNGGQVGPNTTWRFQYILPETATCEGDTAVVTILVEEGPYAGCDGFKAFCLNEAPEQLFSALSCNPDPTGFWLDPSGEPHDGNGIFQPATDQPGFYSYVVPAVGGCGADTARVEVVVRQPANAGQDATVSICSTDAPTNLFTFLGPNAQPGGTWTLNLVNVTGIYNPAVDAPGNYIYRVPGQLPCPADVAIITVTEPLAAYAGDDRTISVCSSDAPFNMRGQLGGLPQQGGTWYDGSGTVHSQFFDPAADDGGVYTYVVFGTQPCANDTARLTVNRAIAPNAGASATVEACATQTEVDLFEALGSGAQTGGVWTDLDLSNALTGDVFNPSVAGNGTFEFEYAVVAQAPCPNAVSIITVEVGSGANAGENDTLTICGAFTDFSLFDALGGDPDEGGTWTDPAGTGALLPSGLLNATLLPPDGQSGFVYTIVDPGCGTVQATVLITTVDYPDPGTAEALILCNNAAPVVLFDELGGTPGVGGTWTGPAGPFDGTLDPATFATGEYTYTLAGNAFCPDTSAVFDVTINARPNAGLAGQLVLCDTLVAYPLFPALNGTPDTGGTWAPVNGAGGLNGANLNTTGLEPGDYEYQYTVQAAGCPSGSALVKVEIVSSPDAVDVSTICNEQDRTYVVSFIIEGGDPLTYTAVGDSGTISAGAPYTFVSEPVVISSPFSVVVSDGFACEPLRVEAVSPCSFETEVFIPESFSPNDDRVNETFFIPGIEGYPNNRITIFNRWGGEVYAAEGYDNRSVVWDGSSPDALLPGSAAAGTYFYVLDLGTGVEPLTGFIQLVR